MGKRCRDYLVPALSVVRGAQRRFARARFGRFKIEEAAGDFDRLLVGLQKCFAVGASFEVLFEGGEVCGPEIRGEIVRDQGGFFLAGQRPSSTFTRLVLVRRADLLFARRATSLHRLLYLDSGNNLQTLPWYCHLLPNRQLTDGYARLISRFLRPPSVRAPASERI
jgi:hypothetical protein